MSPTSTTKKAPTKRTAAKRSTAKRRKPAARPAQVQAPKSPADQVQVLAERAVLVPVGAALTAYDRAFDAVTELATAPSPRDEVSKRLQKGQKRLGTGIKRFERRGTTAQKRVNRQVKKTRTRVERELRSRRVKVERAVRQNRTRIEREVNAVRLDPTARLETVFGNGLTVGQRIVTTAQERVARAA